MVVLLRYQEDLDPTDIAGLLNMPISTPARKGERSAKTLDAASTDAPGVFKNGGQQAASEPKHCLPIRSGGFGRPVVRPGSGA